MQMTTRKLLFNVLNIGDLIMKDYVISYRHQLGDAMLPCYSWEVAGILLNMAHMAIQGISFSNVTITKL